MPIQFRKAATGIYVCNHLGAKWTIAKYPPGHVPIGWHVRGKRGKLWIRYGDFDTLKNAIASVDDLRRLVET